MFEPQASFGGPFDEVSSSTSMGPHVLRQDTDKKKNAYKKLSDKGELLSC